MPSSLRQSALCRAIVCAALPALALLTACGKAPPAVAPTGVANPALGTTAPAGARVFFVEPADGSAVSGPLVDGKVVVKVRFGLEGMQVQAAGALKDGTGHHHIIVDAPGIETPLAVPKDDTHIHYGKGQTDGEVALTPGPHTLTLQFANGAHLSYGEGLRATIRVIVQPIALAVAALPAAATPTAAP